jgi:tetratricopeptide (TPR) repeat protein
MTTDIDQIYQNAFQLRCEGRYGEARMGFERVLSVVPGHVDSLHQIGLIQNFEGDFDGSLATLTNLSTLHPSNLGIRYDLAMTQMMLGMYEEACAQLRYILSIDPNHELAARQATYC